MQLFYPFQCEFHHNKEFIDLNFIVNHFNLTTFKIVLVFMRKITTINNEQKKI